MVAGPLLVLYPLLGDAAVVTLLQVRGPYTTLTHCILAVLLPPCLALCTRPSMTQSRTKQELQPSRVVDHKVQRAARDDYTQLTGCCCMPHYLVTRLQNPCMHAASSNKLPRASPDGSIRSGTPRNSSSPSIVELSCSTKPLEPKQIRSPNLHSTAQHSTLHGTALNTAAPSSHRSECRVPSVTRRRHELL